MGDWEPERDVVVDFRSLFLWRVPKR
jgi:hypothetical protein